MIGTLLLYAEQLVLYHLGAFVCFDRKSRAPLPQLAGGVICLVLARSTTAETISWMR